MIIMISNHYNLRRNDCCTLESRRFYSSLIIYMIYIVLKCISKVESGYVVMSSSFDFLVRPGDTAIRIVSPSEPTSSYDKFSR